MYVYGKNVLKELLNSNKTIYKAYLQENLKDSNIADMLNKKNVKTFYLSKNNLDKITKENHQGVILEIDDYKYYTLNDVLNNRSSNPFIVILDHVEDPHNFGAIIRTCEAAKVDFIIIPKNRSASVNATVMKTSAGALTNVKIAMVTNLNNTIKKLKDSGYWIIGTDMDTNVSYDELDYDMPVCLIIGSEGFGMSKLVKDNCDFIVSIPMYGKVNSLNASVASAIVIYEVLEKRKKVSCEK
ncbi:MAG TPA: 23S rRNA (guanosine(2251)-2'-O)-methyltransferase RlmB [Candidatus Aphodocola excrementigallinarum]|uniref:23S rRNA (Guanosine(2251)-2'-O)-methyltransferase RlmB n=1 Tax=Candidatus Aphodocola excrementigallinarum TaxID=2840670 RepID=A0A9D1ING9_9FIRM|nr:23S rRNA (guanosine(2251)-2'-O)-methyltransferase RlmB [Candidatus Aphodocola excrementigallinarum]